MTDLEDRDTEEHRKPPARSVPPALLFDYRLRHLLPLAKGETEADRKGLIVSCRVFAQNGQRVCHVRVATERNDAGDPMWGELITVEWDGAEFKRGEQSAAFWSLPESCRKDLRRGVALRFLHSELSHLSK